MLRGTKLSATRLNNRREVSITEVHSDNATGTAVAAKVDMKFEMVVIPVSDIHRAREFPT